MNHCASLVGIFCLLLLVLSACEKDAPLVDASFQPYVDRFKTEGESRGYDFEKDDFKIEVRFSNPDDDASLGHCDHTVSPRLILISELFWTFESDLAKERLIFHELGHCILNRAHRDDLDNFGICRSIMNSGRVCADDYSADTRNQYLFELFRSR